jgi:levansucrase
MGFAGGPATTPWTRAHLAVLSESPDHCLPVIGDDGVPHILPDVDFWDLWPMRDADGAVVDVCGGQVWAGLSAPAEGDPGERHDAARVRLVHHTPAGWVDLGPLFPNGASVGSREWAGALTLNHPSGRVEAYYSAAGVRGEPAPTFRQRIMGASATLRCDDGRPVLTGWTPHRELLAPDGRRYQPANEKTGKPGFIKAFRDPFPIRDPASGDRYLLFTGSLAKAQSPDFNGCIGLATAEGQMLDPLISADGVNNELERPHLVVHDAHYYLFFSTQRRTFAPGVTGPTGLYGFVGSALHGPYRPLNGSGLVFQNPPEEPFQAYSWLVLNDLCTTGFVDAYALHGKHPDELTAAGADAVRAHFGGTMTPPIWLGLDGDRAWIVSRDGW